MVGLTEQHWVASLEYKIDLCSIKWTSDLGGALGRGGFTCGGCFGMSSEHRGVREEVISQH